MAIMAEVQAFSGAGSLMSSKAGSGCLVSWPGVIPKGKVSHDLVTSMDTLPTICHLTGTPLPAKKIDGMNIFPALQGKKIKKLNKRYFYYYSNEKPSAIRKGNWKYILPIRDAVATNPGKNGKNGKTETFQQTEALYNLKKNVSESKNVIQEYPEMPMSLKMHWLHLTKL
ncbi:MAG: hypothetical protein SFV55_14955 [Haliscomenobacter sp.]|uniref:sulfatase/phosphatase domain-containing protein n=1 Tax=Haliscomenobacter sp. TaxID=2717303 RepID=UPI0029BF2CFF|nr:sulfatase/phosphatase domain-containing protein [Haliscomenobacter sp.]MDX2069725.1 hypothetical protein [Haliscomenobacter sp.]